MKTRRVTYTENGERRKSKKFYADFYDHAGIRRLLPLFEDEKNSTEAARAVDRLVDVRASGALPPRELRRFIENTLPRIRKKLAEWNIIDAGLVSTTHLLDDDIKLWHKALIADGVEPEYADLKTGRVRTLFRDIKMRRWNDIKPERVRDQLQEYRDAEVGAISVSTSNHYLQAVKQFCRWMVNDQKRALASPLAGMKPIDSGGKSVHDRRAIDIEEFHYLINYLENAPDVFKIPSGHRALIYMFGVETGLRFGAIKRLKVKRIEFHEGRRSVFVPKRNRIKYSKDRWIPLRDEVWEAIRPLVEGRHPTDPIFMMPPKGHGAKMVRHDLDAARAKWIEEAKGDERAKREASDFLRYQDSDGRFADFHAFRHTRGVWLFQHHQAGGRDVQDLMAWAAWDSSIDTLAATSRRTENSSIAARRCRSLNLPSRRPIQLR